MYTYKQISEITGNSIANLRQLVHKLSIPRKSKKGITYISQDGLETLQAHLAPKTTKENGRYKIGVIERYCKTYNYRDVAKMCRISRSTVKNIVEEWEVDECIVVDSSMNFAEKNQNRGIFKRGEKWGYNFTHKGQKYYKFGFKEEYTPTEEMLKLREALK